MGTSSLFDNDDLGPAIVAYVKMDVETVRTLIIWTVS
jgi:hypothetical protein